MNDPTGASNHIHFHFASAPPPRWTVDLRSLSFAHGPKAARHVETTTPLSLEMVDVVDDEGNPGYGPIRVQGTAYDPVYRAATLVQAEVTQDIDNLIDPTNHVHQGAQPIDGVGELGQFEYDEADQQLYAAHSAQGTLNVLIIHAEFVDENAVPFWKHQVTLFYGRTASAVSSKNRKSSGAGKPKK